MYVLHHVSYYGTRTLVAEGSIERCVDAAQTYIARNVPFSWNIIERVTSREWEICEPEDSVMVPEVCGTLTITKVTDPYECLY